MKTRKLLFALMTAATVMFFNSCSDDPKDPCEGIACQNGGTCVNGVCTGCDAGYEGSLCDTVSREKFLGDFTGDDSCTTAAYDVEISTSNSGIDTILIKDFGKFLCNGDAPDVKAGVDGDEIDIPAQTFCSGFITISGEGSISNDGETITISYSTDTTGGSTLHCESVLDRQ